ncbi:hypothetical protein BGX23_005128 [Mortierella sp. AD031]|nr:hypothetical protein BGX23_005128 [Mortierella sp. AD031]
MTTTPDQTPFDLPEIRALIGSFLDHNDRINCILINKAWHDTMSSLVWEKVTLHDTNQHTLDSDDSDDSTISVPIEVLQKNCGLIKTLIIQTYLPEDYFDLVCPILQTLSFWPKRPLPYPDDPSLSTLQGLAAFIRQNPSISQLKLGVSRIQMSLQLWEAIAGAPNLRLLEAPRMRIHHTSLPLFWKTTETLKALIVRFESANRLGESLDIGDAGDDSVEPVMFSRLRRLSLEVSRTARISEADQIRLMARFPQLETLDWLPDNIFTADKFVECIRAETWPNLEGLTLANLDLFTDSDFKAIVESMSQNVTILGVSRSAFGPLAFGALRPHFSEGIIELDLSFCPSVTSAMIVEVLASCKRLRKFAAGPVLATDVVASPPWVCGSLRELWIYFDMHDASMDAETNETDAEAAQAAKEAMQRKIFERIAGLEMLQSFSFSNPMAETAQPSLDLRLGKGLELLASLRELKGIHFHGTLQWMRREDVQWMLDHWSHLHWMGGLMHLEDDDRHNALVKMVTDRGVFFAG